MLAYLQQRPLTHELRRIPPTAGLGEQKDLSLKPVERYLLDALYRGTPLCPSRWDNDLGRRQWDSVELLTSEWYDDFQSNGGRTSKVTYKSFAMRVAALIVSESYRKGQLQGHCLKALADCRAHFDKVTRTPREWPDPVQPSLGANLSTSPF